MEGIAGHAGGFLSGPIDRIHDHCCVGLASLACSILLYSTGHAPYGLTVMDVCTGVPSVQLSSAYGGNRQCCAGPRLSRTETAVLDQGYPGRRLLYWYCTMKYIQYIQNIQYIHCISSELTGPEPDQSFPLSVLSSIGQTKKGRKALTSLFSF